MTLRIHSAAAALLILSFSACGSDGEESVPPEVLDNSVETEPVQPVEAPPMVVRSPSYRCDDGNALYVDVLTDENAVTVRDSRQDIPTRLEREEGAGPFTGQERMLSGTGDEVRYSAPDRPEQTCRVAPE